MYLPAWSLGSTAASLYTAIAILGATVMPHNLYLHSALVQTRRIGRSIEEKRTACKWNLVDCTIALNGAMFVNAAILILAGAIFYRAHKDVTEIQQAYLLLTPIMGTVLAAKLFGIALFASGQSSTLTGTLAGQIVMEGFLNIRVRPWLRRLVTRSLAILPAFVAIWLAGSRGTFQLLLLSQVVLNFQLPFAILPLLNFTNDPRRMGPFASGWWLRIGGWATALIVIGLNIWLAQQTIADWAHSAGSWAPWVWTASLTISAALLGLLAWIALQPYRRPASAPATLGLERQSAELVTAPGLTGASWFRSITRISTASPSATPPASRHAIADAFISSMSKKASPARSSDRNRPPLRSKPAASISTASWNRSARWKSASKPPSGTAPIRERKSFAMPAKFIPICSSWALTDTAASRI